MQVQQHTVGHNGEGGSGWSEECSRRESKANGSTIKPDWHKESGRKQRQMKERMPKKDNNVPDIVKITGWEMTLYANWDQS